MSPAEFSAALRSFSIRSTLPSASPSGLLNWEIRLVNASSTSLASPALSTLGSYSLILTLAIDSLSARSSSSTSTARKREKNSFIRVSNPSSRSRSVRPAISSRSSFAVSTSATRSTRSATWTPWSELWFPSAAVSRVRFDCLVSSDSISSLSTSSSFSSEEISLRRDASLA